MLPIERRQNIVEILRQERRVLVPDLARRFSVTEETVRRDLEKLEAQGQLVRSHGGALPLEEQREELPVKVREAANVQAKERLGQMAAAMVRDGDTLILDASTSALFVARNLRDRQNITVVTNALPVLAELSECPGIQVIATGGTLRHRSQSLVGRSAEAALERYNANWLFFSCKGLSIEHGLTDSNELEADVRRTMLKSARTQVLLCDSSKFDREAFIRTASLDQVAMILTDVHPGDEWASFLEGLGVTLKVAGHSQS